MAEESYGKEAKPAIDVWKEKVLNVLFELVKAYDEAVFSGKMIESDPHVDDFKRKVCSTWLLMGHLKVYLPSENRRFRLLFGLDRYVANPRKMSISQAIDYFNLIRDWIEVLGYTKIESQQYDPTDWPGQMVGL